MTREPFTPSRPGPSSAREHEPSDAARSGASRARGQQPPSARDLTALRTRGDGDRGAGEAPGDPPEASGCGIGSGGSGTGDREYAFPGKPRPCPTHHDAFHRKATTVPNAPRRLSRKGDQVDPGRKVSARGRVRRRRQARSRGCVARIPRRTAAHTRHPLRPGPDAVKPGRAAESARRSARAPAAAGE